MLTLNARKTALVVIDLQEGSCRLPEARTAPKMLSAAPRVWQKNAVPAVPP